MASATPNKACVPCRARKTKCDAATSGLPCSGCVSRNCAEQCVVAARKRRRRPGQPAQDVGAPTPARPRLNPTAITPRAQPLRATSLAWHHSPDSPSRQPSTPDSIDKRQSRTQLHYYHILKEAVDDGALDEQDDKTGTPFGPDEDQTWHGGVPQLDDVDKEYLNKKKVFDLPPKRCIIIHITTYFTMLEPYSPIIDRGDFVHNFESGTCSLFLLCAILAVSSLYVPQKTIEECDFADRAEAQATFASRATLLHDFQAESDALAFLQGSLLMTRVLLEHPTEKDSNYWFYNALRLATKLGLYSHLPAMEAPKLSDWSTERIARDYQDIVPPTTSQQKALFIAICKLSAIYGRVLYSVAKDPAVDLQQLMRPLDAWRMSLATQLQLCNQSPNGNIHYLDLMGTSYRYEATLCRLIQRQLRHVDATKSNYAKQRLRSAMLELDGVTGKILAYGMMKKVPITLQTMLALNQLREIPAIKKAIPLFELILSRKKLYGGGAVVHVPQVAAQCESQWEAAGVSRRPQLDAETEDAPAESFDSFVQEFLEYDTLGDWNFAQVDFSRLV
ncbi:hypothetical protein LLEC1_04756 [Akanthomyces lecanii]|uniref:Zn(2)-C6 fungal-type domain-containing protein n=1 Tax=Cordyceps confragosa TaxID=2714763 RepID=A0A179I5U0_CORDF|nr:hypothetical protein LLEC1_04756 [Akanthomyces lecanii]